MFYWLFYVLFWVIFKTAFRLKVEGRENIPKKTNFIVASNHASFLDPLIIGVAIPKKIYWIAFRHLYNQIFLRWFMSLAKSLPTGKVSEKAALLLMQNKNVGIFPEGQRSHDGKLQEFKRGAALLAVKTARPVLPCAVIGAYQALPRGARFPRLCPIKIKIGKPINILKEYTPVIDDVRLQEGVLKVRNAIKEMLGA
ncbi:MAG: 1-acyl-sn-glycerol-3-phosphate acyltransferase [Candidatus Omnitrophica bacterium CG11_big_fil_rev_8_21_14_0_20_42_13]|uniref:1-acyl-sn-glycerol-3-phosphate acyltransferase n=1 Tax=Candidatus Ghiorseimicrobium undicola TaxID=1974746 RepID=A0A2H0LZN6_9BACT|nr:MAG: 1-acyl-sn-glycerol-3-phosphate acyltransferase [Candidatus Omnitrophica bacterium CG11_big_fil_rev_8_21_14_0_20_42_13]